MKKFLFLTLISIFFMLTVFGQSYIGSTKKEVLNGVKDRALKIEKTQKYDDGTCSITVRFENSTFQYSFTKNNICFFYCIIEKYYPENYFASCKYFDERYKRALDDPCSTSKKTDVWLESKGDYFVYRWIICNINTGTQYTLVLPKENYELNKYTYLQKLLSSN